MIQLSQSGVEAPLVKAKPLQIVLLFLFLTRAERSRSANVNATLRWIVQEFSMANNCWPSSAPKMRRTGHSTPKRSAKNGGKTPKNQLPNRHNHRPVVVVVVVVALFVVVLSPSEREKMAPPTDGAHHGTAFQLMKWKCSLKWCSDFHFNEHFHFISWNAVSWCAPSVVGDPIPNNFQFSNLVCDQKRKLKILILKIQNLKVLSDQIRPQIENAIAIAIQIAIAIAKFPKMKNGEIKTFLVL